MKPLIGILSQDLAPPSYWTVIADLPIRIIVFTAAGVSTKRRRVTGRLLQHGAWRPTTARLPDVIYNNRYSSTSTLTKQLQRAIGNERVFNVTTRFDKGLIYKILLGSKLKSYTIPTYVYTAKRLRSLLQTHESVVIKPALGHLGRHVWRIRQNGGRLDFFEQNAQIKESFASLQQLVYFISNLTQKRRFLLQPFIKFAVTRNDLIFDMRIFLQKDSNGRWAVTADFARVAFINYYVTNVATSVQPISEVLEDTDFGFEVLSKAREIGLVTAKIVEKTLGSLCEVSVDIGLEPDGHLRIIEVNGMPHKKVLLEFDEELYVKAVRAPFEYGVFLARR